MILFALAVAYHSPVRNRCLLINYIYNRHLTILTTTGPKGPPATEEHSWHRCHVCVINISKLLYYNTE
ncbi:hypothetical protein GDO78_014098 [Eleutherodactylus coqui]|uniref:Uncharacterized protein n=1 Tax=Eleutherodactylus coqui TaxID=57060 RepID=A0A8J6BH20_ELECQ|nr:hypothetical protein GDO78_014098 [Eleutherodactylus coqui]